ncbi:hypothetical protein ETD86_49100 [Nonomuraea turkmeniaca]|uniref:Uncharacterized protein n=1 Tax=Nonomuraea turkmeniaca TaxID=103838 RepID=A0A5S4EWY9_9ACTN|nr:hypothetical protein [Nonomuraea turkmeniaca]TMR08139.1 hypothetical protein ETD86_49100 [Nonomuraea turkmeniaca]
MTVLIAPASGAQTSQGTIPIVARVPIGQPDPLLALERIAAQTAAAKASCARPQAELFGLRHAGVDGRRRIRLRSIGKAPRTPWFCSGCSSAPLERLIRGGERQ